MSQDPETQGSNPEDQTQETENSQTGTAPAVGDQNSENAQEPNQAQRSREEDEAVVREDAPLAKDLRITPNPGEDVGESQVQEQVDKEEERGFRGVAADPTPNEHYTVSGVTSNKPTPETSFEQRRVSKDSRQLDEGVESY